MKPFKFSDPGINDTKSKHNATVTAGIIQDIPVPLRSVCFLIFAPAAAPEAAAVEEDWRGLSSSDELDDVLRLRAAGFVVLSMFLWVWYGSVGCVGSVGIYREWE